MSTFPGAARAIASPRTSRRARRVAVIDTPVGRLGLSVCYDVRFPELYRRLSAAGAQLLAVPSAFTSPTGRAHWETLLRARAIENLCYVVAPAQSGFHPSGRETYGDSMIVDYWGRVLQRVPRGRGSAVAEVDLARRPACARVSRRCCIGFVTDRKSLRHERFPAARSAAHGPRADPAPERARRSPPRAGVRRGARALGGFRRPVLPARAPGVLVARGRHRQGRQRQHRAGRGRAGTRR